MTLIALATAIFVIQLDSWQLEKFYFYEVKKKPQNFGYFLDFSELLVVCYLIMGYLQK